MWGTWINKQVLLHAIRMHMKYTYIRFARRMTGEVVLAARCAKLTPMSSAIGSDWIRFEAASHTDVELKRKILRDHFRNGDFRDAIAHLNGVLRSFDRSLRATTLCKFSKASNRATLLTYWRFASPLQIVHFSNSIPSIVSYSRRGLPIVHL